MQAYFSNKLKSFFPGAQQLVNYQFTHRPTLSTASYLTRFDLTIRYGSRTATHHVRGNSIDTETAKIFLKLHQKKTSFRSPRLLTYFPKPGYILYEEVLGSTLRELPFKSLRWPSTISAIDKALADFHQTPTTTLRKLPWSAEATFIRACQKNIVRHSPHRKTWAQKAVSALLQHERTAWSRQTGLVHKDFQASNIILGKSIGIIDFTLSGQGPTIFDLGTFVTHLSVMSLGHLSAKKVTHLRETFLNAYISNLKKSAQQMVIRDLPIFELRSALDILSITLQNVGEKSGAGKLYCDLLTKRIDSLVTQIENQ